MFYCAVCKILTDVKNIVCVFCVEKYKADKKLKYNWPFDI